MDSKENDRETTWNTGIVGDHPRGDVMTGFGK